MTKRVTTFDMARVLASLHETHSGTKATLAAKLVLDEDLILRALKGLERRGFVFCNDKFDDHGPAWSTQGNRRRTGGKYANALWCVNYEPNPITEYNALELIQTADHTKTYGRDVAFTAGYGC